MNMKQEQKAALKTQIELINFGNEINQAAELWKLRLQKQIFPDGPEVSRQLVAQLYADYHRWVSKQEEFYRRFLADERTLARFFEADSVIAHGMAGQNVGKSTSDPEMLRLVKRISHEARKKLRLLQNFESTARVDTNREIRIAKNTEDSLVVVCHGVRSQPFSKNKQSVVALEYILNRLDEEGAGCAILKEDVWNWILHQHRVRPFKYKPEKKELNSVRLSVDRHLQEIERFLREEFPSLDKGKLFPKADIQNAFIPRI